MTVDDTSAPGDVDRRRRWQVAEVADVAGGHAEVEALFGLLGATSGWQYPPHERIEALGSLSAWVWISPGAQRWEARAPGGLVGTVQLQLLAEDRSSGALGDSLAAYWEGVAAEVATALDVPVTADGMAVVERLAVHPTVRREGTGTALLAAAVSRAHTLGRLPVLVVLAHSAPAVALYRRRGGAEVARRRGLSGREVLVFAFPAET